jgi:hypothetical protein
MICDRESKDFFFSEVDCYIADIDTKNGEKSDAQGAAKYAERLPCHKGWKYKWYTAQDTTKNA